MEANNKSNGLGWVQAFSNPILDIASGFLNQWFAKQQMEQQFKYNKQMADINQKYALEAMKYQSNLNEISAQKAYDRNMQMYQQTQSTGAKVREMEQAGLSVGMINGTPSQGGASSAGIANTGLATGAAAGVGLAGVSPMNLILDIMGAKKMQAEIDLLKTQKDKVREEADNERIRGNILALEEALKNATNANDYTLKSIELQKAEIELFFLKKDKDYYSRKVKAEVESQEQQVNKLKAEILLINANKDLSESQKKLTEQEALNAIQTFKKIQAETANMWVTVEDEEGNEVLIPKSQADYDNFQEKLKNELIKQGIASGGAILNNVIEFLLPGGKIKKMINIYNNKPRMHTHPK